MITIRNETPEDYDTVLRLNYDAFVTLHYEGRVRADEHYLIHLLRNSPSVIRELTFVAERDGEIAGHILYTHSAVVRSDGSETPTLTFGPLCVKPKYHKQGIGALLVRHSMDAARRLGHGAVLITGVPDYYPKLGFKRAREYGLTQSDGTSPDSFMAYELTPGYLGGAGGVLRFLAPEYELSEVIGPDFDEFHARFCIDNGIVD
jgi:predicted N-acetyltransferase YhbS